jgi:signal transduction histidine kinase
MGGHMTGIGLLAQTLQTHLSKASSPLAAKAEDLVRSIDEAQKQLRSIVRELMPVEAIQEGLMAALQELATQAETQYGIGCHFECERPVYVDDPVAAKHVFRIVQEAVNNAVRHGKPTQITIGLEQLEGRLEVMVSDDGDGLKEMPDGRPGIGLESMRQRAHLLGGDLSVQPRKSGGTVVLCWMPLPSAAPDAHGLPHRGNG